MFLIPDIIGLSFVFSQLIDNIDFEGNIYLIDDFKYGMTSDEIKNIENNSDSMLNHYYESIKDLFNDGDIIAAYSLGCIYASLIAEKLEQTKQIDKCIFIDGNLKFVSDVEISKEFMDSLIDEYCDDRLEEIYCLNSSWSFHTPQIKSKIIYLSASGLFRKDLNNMSDNYVFIQIDSTHEDIIKGC